VKILHVFGLINWVSFFKLIKKNIYYDGHECSDIIAYREKFLLEIKKLEKLMPKPIDEDITIIIEP